MSLGIEELIVVGAGGAAAEVVSYIAAVNRAATVAWKIEGFLDADSTGFTSRAEKYRFPGRYLGTPDEHKYSERYSYVLAFSDARKKLALVERLSIMGLKFPNVIHPTASIAETCLIGRGNIIGPHCVVGPAAVLGDFNLVTAYSFISHDAVVGSANFLSTAGLSGASRVGNGSFLGIRSTLLPGVAVGDHCTVQAGMVVDTDVPDHSTVFYRYKEKREIIFRDGGIV